MKRLKSWWHRASVKVCVVIALLLILTSSLSLLVHSFRSAVIITVRPKFYRYEATSKAIIPIEKHSPASLSAEIKTLFYQAQGFPANHASGMLVFTNKTEND